MRRFDHISQFKNNIFGISLYDYLNFRVALFIFKTLNLSNSPEFIKSKFNFAHSTRTNVIILSTHNTSYMSNALLVRGANIWNNIPLSIRNVASIGQFKKHCLEFYASS